MDKIFNFFSKTKSKEEIEKQKRNSIINTQNLQNLANVNHSSLTNIPENNAEASKTINFTSEDFANIDKILNKNQENNINSDTKTTEKDINALDEIKTENTLENQASVNQAQNFVFNKNNTTGLLNKPAVGDVVTVNSIENLKKPGDGFYTKKYKEHITNLKSVIIIHNLEFFEF